MDNLEWLEKMKKNDDTYKYDECGWPTPEWRIKFRHTKALEIIAEELIKSNKREKDKEDSIEVASKGTGGHEQGGMI